MKGRLGLVVTGLAFVIWLGWLGFLAFAKTKPTVISRAQLMSATHVVVAEIDLENEDPQPKLKVKQVLKPTNEKLDNIFVGDIRNGRLPGGAAYQHKGQYLILLKKTGQNYALANTAIGPGDNYQAMPRPWLYPWTPEVEAQINRLLE